MRPKLASKRTGGGAEICTPNWPLKSGPPTPARARPAGIMEKRSKNIIDRSLVAAFNRVNEAPESLSREIWNSCRGGVASHRRSLLIRTSAIIDSVRPSENRALGMGRPSGDHNSRSIIQMSRFVFGGGHSTTRTQTQCGRG